MKNVTISPGTPARSSEALVQIDITNINDNPPVFQQDTPYIVFVEHGTNKDDIILTVQVDLL